MSKIATALLTGMMVKDGLLDIDRPAPVVLWEEEGCRLFLSQIHQGVLLVQAICMLRQETGPG